MEVSDNLEAAEHSEEQDDVFFTEDVYEMFSLSRTHNVRALHHGKTKSVKPLREWRDTKVKEKPKKSQRPTPTREDSSNTAKQTALTHKDNRLICPNSSFSYPTFSRLTLTQHKTFLELQAKYGSKGVRVTTSQESAEHQQWRQLGAQIYLDQQDFNAFAECVAQKSPKNYLDISPAAVKLTQDALKRNLQRVESLPRHYTVLQTFTLNPGVPLPSDAALQRIGSPIFLGKIPELHIPGLEGRKVSLTRSVPEEGDASSTKQTYCYLQENNVQKLAEAHKADIVISTASLLTLVDNHSPHYERQWEIPIEVKARGETDGSLKSSLTQKVVLVKKPLRKHFYYPHEAGAMYHKFALKMMLTRESEPKYGIIEKKAEDENICEDGTRIEDGEERRGGREKGERCLNSDEMEQNRSSGEEFEEFGAASILDLETFGCEMPFSRTFDRQEVKDCEDEKKGENGRGAGKSADDADRASGVEDQFENNISGKGILSDQDSATPQMGAASGEIQVEISASSEEESSGEDAKLESVNRENELSGTNDVKLYLKKASQSDNLTSVHLDNATERNDRKTSEDECKPVVSGDSGGLLLPCQKANVTAKRVFRRFISDSSSDDDRGLMIVTDSDKQESSTEWEKRKSRNSCRLKRLDAVVENDDKTTDITNQLDKGSAVEMSVVVDVMESVGQEERAINNGITLAPISSSEELTEIVAKEIGDNGEKDDLKMREEGETSGIVMMRRSARLGKQGSANDKTKKDIEGRYRRKLRRRGGPAMDEASDDDIADVTSVTQKSSSQTGMKLRKRKNGSEQKDDADRDVDSSACETEIKKRSVDLMGELASGEQMSSAHDHEKEHKSKLVHVKCDEKKASDTDENKADQQKGSVKLGTNTLVSPGKGNNTTDQQKNVFRKRKSLKQIAGDKVVSTSKKPASSRNGSVNTSKTESTMDEIMRLQEKMLNRQKSSMAAPPPSTGSVCVRDEERGRLGEGAHPSGKGGTTAMMTSLGGVDLEEPREGNAMYSLWKFGRLRMLIRSRCHGVLMGGPEPHQRDQMVSIIPKVEHQTDFGLEMLTASELTRAWLHMYLRPGSIVIRGRIDAQTSEILSWEYVDSASLMQSQQTFQPAMCLKTLHHIVGKLAGLSEGKYLLRHRPGDAHVCIYQCVEQTARNITAPYDLHAAHQASKLLTSLPPTIPWVPLDPNAPYSRERWKGCVPLTFPPCPRNFKHPSSQQGGKHRKRKKKNKGKGSSLG